jgi:hypothetical protein
MPKLTVATPTIRVLGAQVTYASLQKQTFRDFEWLICTPASLVNTMQLFFPSATVYADPPLPNNYITRTYAASNLLATRANSDVVVSCMDYTELSSNALANLYDNYCHDPKRIYCVFGDFYHSIDIETFEFYDFGFTNRCHPDSDGGHPITARQFDSAFAYIPKCAYYEVGGIDEMYDMYFGNGEKDFVARLEKIGYEICTDHSIIMKGYLSHGRVEGWRQELWDMCVKKFDADMANVDADKRLKLNYIL